MNKCFLGYGVNSGGGGSGFLGGGDSGGFFCCFFFAGCVTFSMLFISPQQGSRSRVVISERPTFLQRESVYKGKKKPTQHKTHVCVFNLACKLTRRAPGV